VLRRIIREASASQRSSLERQNRPTTELLDFLKEKGAEKLAIDLRQNPGGDYFEDLHHLIEPSAKNPSLNRKGHLLS